MRFIRVQTLGKEYAIHSEYEQARITAIRQERIWNSYYKLYDNFYFVFGEILLCGNKKKVPFEVYKRIFWKKCTNKSLHILRGKMSEVAIFREWVLEVEVARTMQDSLQHFYFPVCPLAKFGSFLFQIIASPRTRLEKIKPADNTKEKFMYGNRHKRV
jgi:hypothetical protein